ncbi:DNA alkylation repair protein [Arthrobacter sp. SA17]
MTDPGEFVDAALQREGSWSRAQEAQDRLGNGLRFYGASVGAVRGAIRDASRRYRDLIHDDITALSTELWEVPVFERRLAAIVLLQSHVRLLKNTDLTRLEGFVRDSHLPDLVDPLAVDVIGPLVTGLDVLGRVRADSVLDRWARDPDEWLRRASILSQLRELRGALTVGPPLSGGRTWRWKTLRRCPTADWQSGRLSHVLLGKLRKTEQDLSSPSTTIDPRIGGFLTLFRRPATMRYE